MAERKPTMMQSVITPPEKGPVMKGIDQLLGKLPADSLPTKFPVSVAGCILLFRYPESVADWDQYQAKGTEFIQQILKTIKDAKEQKPVPPAVATALDLGERKDPEIEDIVTAWTIHFWSHKDEKIDPSQAIRMVRANPSMAWELAQTIDREIKLNQYVIKFAGVTERKKASKKTGLNTSGSKPQSSTAKATQTN